MISNKSNKYLIHEVLEDFAQNGINQLKESLTELLNQLMLAEREDFVGAGRYERTSERKGHCNGFKNKNFLTRLGELQLQVPQVRNGDFYPTCLDKGEKVEQALKVALAEAYVQGVSTRRMKKVTEELCGKEISSTQVSRLAKVLDEEVEKFKKRALGCYVYLFLDAQYEKVRYEGTVRSIGVLKAVGITPNGCREILAISCSLSEAEVHWRDVLEDLTKRGLHGVKLITSDDHSGLRAALRAVLASIPWQRCIFHLAENALAYSPTIGMKQEISQAVKELYQSIDKIEAETRLKRTVDRFKDKASRFCEWLEENFIEGLTFYNFPKAHWKKIRTVNIIERINQEQKRRTQVARLFPSVESCERLVVTIGMRINEEWGASKQYLKM